MTDRENEQLDRIEKAIGRLSRAVFGSEDPQDKGIEDKVDDLMDAVYGGPNTPKDQAGSPLGIQNKVDRMYRILETAMGLKNLWLGVAALLGSIFGSALFAAVRDFFAGGSP